MTIEVLVQDATNVYRMREILSAYELHEDNNMGMVNFVHNEKCVNTKIWPYAVKCTLTVDEYFIIMEHNKKLGA